MLFDRRTVLPLFLVIGVAALLPSPAAAGWCGDIVSAVTGNPDHGKAVDQLGKQLGDGCSELPVGRTLQQAQDRTAAEAADVAEKVKRLLKQPTAENAADLLDSVEAACADGVDLPDAILEALRLSLPGEQTNRDEIMAGLRKDWTHVLFSDEIAVKDYEEVAAARLGAPDAAAAALAAWAEKFTLANAERMAEELAKDLEKEAGQDRQQVKAAILEEIRQVLGRLPRDILDGNLRFDKLRLPGVRFPVDIQVGLATYEHWFGFPEEDRLHLPMPSTYMIFLRWKLIDPREPPAPPEPVVNPAPNPNPERPPVQVVGLREIVIFPVAVRNADGQRIPVQTRRWLRIQNATGERLRVWVQFRTLNTSGKWEWYPVDPAGGSHQAASVVFAPGQTSFLLFQGLAINASRVRLWAESESGQIWPQYHDQDLWLVNDVNGQRAYYAAQMNVYTYRFDPPDESALWLDRSVRVKNATKVPLIVQARARTYDWDEGSHWQLSPPTRLLPGQTVQLRDQDGWLMRGDKIKIWAEDEKQKQFRWNIYKDHALRQVEVNGYEGPAIGTVTYLLQPPPPNDRPPEKGKPELALAAETQPLPADEMWVPAVKGMPLDRARAELEKQGLRPAHGKDAPPHARVVSQDPQPGWQPAAAVVKLTLESESSVIVPDLNNDGAEQAQARLKEVGLKLIATTKGESGLVVIAPEKYAASLKGYRVVKQSPTHLDEQGKPRTIEKGKTVSCLFEPSSDLVDVPDVGKQSIAEAEQAIQEAGLKFEGQVKLDKGYQPLPAGKDRQQFKGFTVVRQDPTPKENQKPRKVPRGSKVVCYFERPAPVSDDVEVPDVMHRDYLDAQRMISEKGLRLVAQVNIDGERQTVAPEKAGQLLKGFRVLEQEPTHFDERHRPARLPRGGHVTCLFQAPLVEVPDVIHHTGDEAERRLKEVGLAPLFRIQGQPGPGRPLDPQHKTYKVANQDPSRLDNQGRIRQVSKGTSVVCILVKDEPKIEKRPVPPVTGKLATAAEQLLHKDEFQMETRLDSATGPHMKPDARVTVADGTTKVLKVIDQKPEPYDAQRKPNLAPKGSTVLCVVKWMALPPEEVPVPRLKDRTLAQAKQEAEKVGLFVAPAKTPPVKKETKEAAKIDQVLVENQSPEGGKLARGKTIEVWMVHYVRAQETKVPVPPVTNMELEEAKQKVAKVHLTIHVKETGQVAEQPTDDPKLVGKIMVKDQNPGAYVPAPEHSAILVTICKYVKADDKVPVPPLKGMTIEAATQAAGRLGLTVRQGKVRTAEATERDPIGQAIVEAPTNPPQGTKVSKGTAIVVDVVRYVKPAVEQVTVPEFRRLSPEHAEQAAHQRGLAIQHHAAGKENTHDSHLDGQRVVRQQSRDPGSRVPKGTIIQLHVVTYVLVKPPPKPPHPNPPHPKPPHPNYKSLPTLTASQQYRPPAHHAQGGFNHNRPQPRQPFRR